MNSRDEFVQPIPTLDLRKFCRDRDKVKTTVRLHWGKSDHDAFDWLILGQVRLHSRSNNHFPGVWVFDSYFEGHTDAEHDSAFIVNFELIGVEFECIRYGQTHAFGFINPNLDPQWDQFSVPPQDYDPFHNSSDCQDCKDDKHKFVSYLPPSNMELYRKIRGKRVEIITGIIHDETTD